MSTSALSESSLSDAYELWLQAPHANKPGSLNRDRSVPDLLNHKRALRCYAAGYSQGTKDMSRVPISALEISETLVAKYVGRGVEILAVGAEGSAVTKKTVANLSSCLRAVRAVVLKDRNIPVQGKSARKRLDALPKRRSRVRFPTKSWPERFKDEWRGYREWKIKPILNTSEGAAYRRERCRPITIDNAHVSNINPYVGFLVREYAMTDFGLAEACDPELFTAFINWHLSQEADGGFVSLKHTAAVLATLSQYLVAKGELPEVRDGKKLWDAFYDLGRKVMRLGADQGKIVAAVDVGDWTPDDLRAIGLEAWGSEPPQDKMTSPYVHANAVFNRRRTGLFFFLAYETPLRARNWREMQWGRNLMRMENGRWKALFIGEELKIGRRGFTTNVYEHVYSKEASHMIDRFRGVLEERFGPDFEALAPYVFTPSQPNRHRSGSKLSHGAFASGVSVLVMELRGETFHPHKVRHIVASYLVNRHGPGGLGLAAKLLGDTPQVILDAYYRPNSTQDLADYLSSNLQPHVRVPGHSRLAHRLDK